MSEGEESTWEERKGACRDSRDRPVIPPTPSARRAKEDIFFGLLPAVSRDGGGKGKSKKKKGSVERFKPDVQLHQCHFWLPLFFSTDYTIIIIIIALYSALSAGPFN